MKTQNYKRQSVEFNEDFIAEEFVLDVLKNPEAYLNPKIVTEPIAGIAKEKLLPSGFTLKSQDSLKDLFVNVAKEHLDEIIDDLPKDDEKQSFTPRYLKDASVAFSQDLNFMSWEKRAKTITEKTQIGESLKKEIEGTKVSYTIDGEVVLNYDASELREEVKGAMDIAVKAAVVLADVVSIIFSLSKLDSLFPDGWIRNVLRRVTAFRGMLRRIAGDIGRMALSPNKLAVLTGILGSILSHQRTDLFKLLKHLLKSIKKMPWYRIVWTVVKIIASIVGMVASGASTVIAIIAYKLVLLVADVIKLVNAIKGREASLVT